MRRSPALAANLFLTLLLLCAARSAHSAESSIAFSRNARTIETEQSSLLVKGVAHACLTLTSLHDSLPCNPAMIALTKKARMGVTALLSNGYPTLDRMQKLLLGDLSQEQIDKLFGGDRVTQIEGNVEIAFRSQYIAAKYTPYNPKYFSAVRNEANPDVDLFAVNEKNLVIQGGYQVYRGVLVGAQIRSIEREFIKQRFHLFDVATPAGRELLRKKNQTALFFEPSAAYFFGGEYNPRASVMLANLALSRTGSEQINTPMNLQAGVGFTPPLRWGVLEVGLDYRQLTEDASMGESLHMGANYQFGTMSLVAGVDAAGVSAGVYHGLDQIYAGIMCSTTQVPWHPTDYYAQTVYLEVGWSL